MPREKQQKLTVYLLAGNADRAAWLREQEGITSVVIPALNPVEPSLFVKATLPHPPAWQRYVEASVPEGLGTLWAASSGAALLIEAAERLFVVTFGQGRHLIDPGSYERDFGLKVVLNTVSLEHLKSMDARTVEDTPMHTRRDASRDSALSAFAFDVSRDLLRAITGKPSDEQLGNRLSGSDALSIHTKLTVPELPSLMELLLDAYQSDAYKEQFDFIDYLRAEKRAERIDQLDAKLLDDLRNRQLTDAHLAVPETLDWIDVAGFHFSTEDGDDLQSDPSISRYVASRGPDDLTITTLKRDKVVAVHDTYERRWSVYDSLVYEAEIDGALHVLTGGDWFRVQLDFKAKVDEELQRLQELDGLPAAEPGTNEDEYNRMAAEILGAALLDKRFVLDGTPDKTEICDLLLPDKTLLHVKQRGKSSTLSHLFAQGVNSAERLLGDADFRLQARALVEPNGENFSDAFPDARPNPSEYTVAFAVITRSSRPTVLTLPFFSLVSLRAAARRLSTLGFNVKIAAVRETA